MTRRAFLFMATALSAAGAGAASIVAWKERRLILNMYRVEGFGRTPLARLRSHYSWLNVAPAAFDQYLADRRRLAGSIDRFSILWPDFYTTFLLSTDFFVNGGIRPRSSEPVQYMMFYDPASSPCYNPLAQRPPSDAELAASRG